MSNPNNTLLGRCALAYQESGSNEHLCSMAAVFEHLAAEVLLMAHYDPELTIDQLASTLIKEAEAAEPCA
jgi:hypothetical protein